MLEPRAGTGRASVEKAPDALGPFTIEGVLGEGGSAVVYAASWRERKVALKVPRSDAELTRKEQSRFLAEAQHLARVRHESIVEVLDSGRLPDGRPYLAMSYCEGETLAQRLERVGPLPTTEALSLFGQLAAATEALHVEGLVHRDLKPENVFLVDGGRAVKLLDFGIAKAIDAEPSTTTQAGIARGTPATMAPERFFGAPASVATDIYELAVVVYAMLVGKLPWADTTAVEARLDPLSPEAAGATVPKGVSRALMRALSTRPERRPPTVRDLARSILDGTNSAPNAGDRVTAKTAPSTGARDAPTAARSSDDAHVLEPAPDAVPARAPTRRAVVLGLAIGVAVGLGVGIVRTFSAGGTAGTAARARPAATETARAAPPPQPEPRREVTRSPAARTARVATSSEPIPRADRVTKPPSRPRAHPSGKPPSEDAPPSPQPGASVLPGGVYEKAPY